MSEKKKPVISNEYMFLILGLLLGMMITYGFWENFRTNNECGDVVLDSYDFEQLTNQLWSAKVKNHQCEFVFEILQLEFNITGMLKERNLTELYGIYIKEFDDFEKTMRELHEEIIETRK